MESPSRVTVVANWRKFLMLPGLVLTTLITVLLLLSDQFHSTNSGRFYQLVVKNRASTQVFVGLLAASLAAVQIYVLSTLMSFSTRLRLAEKSATLNLLKTWNALCTGRLDWSLSPWSIVVLVIFHISTLLPGAIWIGALTPVATSTASPSSPSTVCQSCPKLAVPQYSNASSQYWAQLDWISPQTSLRNSQGVFTYSPNYELQGLILNEAAGATSVNGSSPLQKKFDNSGYTYTGRSFGVGSSVGLVDDLLNSSTMMRYSYQETGYQTQVDCIVNTTSNWRLTEYLDPGDRTYPLLYLASGNLTNGASEGYAACGLEDSSQIVALVGSSFEGKNVFAIAAGQEYTALDGLQCNVAFIPTSFNVSVNVTSKSIVVKPLPPQGPIPDLEPSGKLVAITMRMPTSFSQQNACDLYTSVIGNTFVSNIKNTDLQFDPSDVPLDPKITLQGVEGSLSSMLDSSLLAFSSAQLIIANDTQHVFTSTLVKSIRIGESSYIHIIFCINLFIILVFFFELARTKSWKDLHTFDYTDIKSVVVAASMGGTAIGKAAVDKLQKGGDGEKQVGRITVSLVDRGGDGLALTYNRKDMAGEWPQQELETLTHGEEISRTPTSNYDSGIWDEADVVERRSTTSQ